MTTMSVIDARKNLADVLNRVAYRGERIAFARRGKAVAVLVSPEDLAMLEQIENNADLRDAKTALHEYQRNPESAVTLAEYHKKRKTK